MKNESVLTASTGSATAPSTIRVFYSWQSDRSDGTNRGFIRECLKEAKAVIQADKSVILNVHIDEATRDETGAPDIAATILNKIVASDIIVSDVSIINEATNDKRLVPNPNVLIELGFAAARIGWPRVVLVFNIAFGRCPDNLPFDIRTRRAVLYHLADGADPSKRGNEKKKLTDALVGLIRDIAAKNPSRPMDESDASVRRARDVEMLSVLCGSFDLAAVEQQCIDIQRGFVTDEVLFYYDCFKGILGSLSFHLYDKDAKNKADALVEAWSEAMPRSGFTEQINRGYMFKQRGIAMTDEEDEEWERMERSYQPLYDTLKGFANYIREKYLEIDLIESSRRARTEWAK